ncbi:hypothetical protein LINGRAHAP2_LOCUS24863, partial [Linum grandiflorum]
MQGLQATTRSQLFWTFYFIIAANFPTDGPIRREEASTLTRRECEGVWFSEPLYFTDTAMEKLIKETYVIILIDP